MKKYLIKFQVDTWLQKLLSKVGLVIGVEYDKDDKHLVALFITREEDF